MNLPLWSHPPCAWLHQILLLAATDYLSPCLSNLLSSSCMLCITELLREDVGINEGSNIMQIMHSMYAVSFFFQTILQVCNRFLALLEFLRMRGFRAMIECNPFGTFPRVQICNNVIINDACKSSLSLFHNVIVGMHTFFLHRNASIISNYPFQLHAVGASFC